MKVPKKPTNAWANWIAILLGHVSFVGDEIDSPTKGVDRFVHPFSVNMAVEEVGGLNPGCEISYLPDKKTCKVVNCLLCFGVGMSAFCPQKIKIKCKHGGVQTMNMPPTNLFVLASCGYVNIHIQIQQHISLDFNSHDKNESP
jgi:hypothetical protein